MESKFKLPPRRKKDLSTPIELAKKLSSLIDLKIPLVKKARTDGSNLRKLIARTLSPTTPLPAEKEDFIKIPPKGKGLPKILLEYIDTYIITGDGSNYNLQVWNRHPASESVLVEYVNGETLSAHDVRFVLGKIHPQTHHIESILILTPDYIVENFGAFGKPTIKYQMTISDKARQNVIERPNSTLFYMSAKNVGMANNVVNLSTFSIKDAPTKTSILPIESIYDIVTSSVVGKIKISPNLSTKERGQELERIISMKLGYDVSEADLMEGGYPDIRNQALEIKVQDSPTVDLGQYTPAYEESVPNCPGFTTGDIRYLIALTNSESGLIEGIVLCEGNKLGRHFTHIADKSYKCQRSIPMEFFEQYRGQSRFNP